MSRVVDGRRFEALWNRCCIAPCTVTGKQMFKEIESLYAEPHRRYHTARHIEACLGLFDLAAPRMEQPDEVEIALWFHDVIYELCAADNERRSADLFIERAGDGVDEAFRRRVEALIMVTVTHENPQGVDEAFMIDIDLSSFGQPWEGFLRDSKAVREELPHVADDDFQGQAQAVSRETAGARSALQNAVHARAAR